MAIPSTPVLPPEIWENIFWQHTEPFHLWHECRQVSRFWRGEIPYVFAAKHLQRPLMTEVKFNCGDDRWISMRFDKLDPNDRSRCIFVEDIRSVTKRGSPDEKEEFDNLKCASWRKRVNAYLGADAKPAEDSGRHLPAHTVRVKAVANDTELPALRCDFDNRSISFEWFGMFNLLYREEMNLRHRIIRYLDARDPPQIDPIADPDAYMQALMKLSKEMEQQMENTQRAIRRRRIQRFYKEHSNLDIKIDSRTFCKLEENQYLRKISEAKDDGCYIKFAEDRDQRRKHRRKGKRDDEDTEDEGDEDVYENGYRPYYGVEAEEEEEEDEDEEETPSEHAVAEYHVADYADDDSYSDQDYDWY